MAALRVVLDTNVLRSGIAYPDSIPGKILTAWRRGSVAVSLSGYSLEELRRVLPKLAHRHGLSTIDIDDQPVLGTLLAALRSSGAGYLITGDRDRLAVPQHASFDTVTRRRHSRAEGL